MSNKILSYTRPQLHLCVASETTKKKSKFFLHRIIIFHPVVREKKSIDFNNIQLMDILADIRHFDRDINERFTAGLTIKKSFSFVPEYSRIHVCFISICFISADFETPVCGGRLYKRKFSKKDFPILGAGKK
jgi:hypothetical protein